MFEALYEYLEKTHPLSTVDKEMIHDVFIPKKLLKGEFLLREGDLLKYGAFVCKGFLRSYVVDNKGKNAYYQFAPENWWISIISCRAEGTNASCFIDAIEDSDMLLIDQPDILKCWRSTCLWQSFRAACKKSPQR
jgi:hypothetical protein